MDAEFVHNEVSSELSFDLDVNSCIRLDFFNETHALVIELKNGYKKFRIVDVNSGANMTGLEPHMDKYEFNAGNLNQHSIYRSQKNSNHQRDLGSLCFKKGSLNIEHEKWYHMLFLNDKFYLALTIVDTETQQMETTFCEYSIRAHAFCLERSNKISYDINFSCQNSLYFDHLYVDEKPYSVFSFSTPTHKMCYLVNYDSFEIYKIPGRLYMSNAFDNKCECHPYTFGYVEHVRKLLFYGTDSYHWFDFITHRVHQLKSPDDISPICPVINYDEVIEKYVFMMPSKVFIFKDYYALDKSESSDMKCFRIERSDEEIVLEAATYDKSTIWRHTIYAKEFDKTFLVANFEILGRILEDAFYQKKPNVELSHKMNNNEDLEIRIVVKTDYLEFTLYYTLVRIKYPLDVQTEIEALGEEIKILREQVRKN